MQCIGRCSHLISVLGMLPLLAYERFLDEFVSGMIPLLVLKLLFQECCLFLFDWLLQVYLPTGMYVDASINSKASPFLNIRVQASVTDFQHTEGMHKQEPNSFSSITTVRWRHQLLSQMLLFSLELPGPYQLGADPWAQASVSSSLKEWLCACWFLFNSMYTVWQFSSNSIYTVQKFFNGL